MEEKKCSSCNHIFSITDDDLLFLNSLKSIKKIPLPKLCPDCRQQRKLAFRNERKLYKRKCDFSGKDIISVFSPDKPHLVYDKDIRWSDKWNALDYGIDYDKNESFNKQFHKLDLKIPHMSLMQVNLEDSEYCNVVANSKSCYLVFASSKLEKCLYGTSLEKCEYVVDCTLAKDSKNCYESVMLNNCNSLFYSNNCDNCSNGFLLRECENCRNCLLCSDIKNSSYYVWNKAVSKQEFEAEKGRIQKLDSRELERLKQKFKKWTETIPKCFANIVGSEQVSGDNIINCSKTYESFDCFETEKSKYLVFCIFGVKNCYDCMYSGHNIELCYDNHLVVFGSSNVYFSDHIQGSSQVYYSSNCIGCNNIFGCTGLKNRSYCILNKQYSKDEYFTLIGRITDDMEKNGEWGEFLSPSVSPFGYNETLAFEYYPLLHPSPPKEKGLGMRFNWSDYEQEIAQVEKIIDASSLPDTISDIPDDILNWAIRCLETKKLYRINKTELEFYRKNCIPIPKKHPDQRHLERGKQRNPRKLYDRECVKCTKKLRTSFSSSKPEIIYCQDCYDKFVY